MKNLPDSLAHMKSKGHTLIGCFPLYPPLELLHSFGLTPVVLWGLRQDITHLTRSDRHLQSYTCGVARSLSEFVLSHGSESLDAMFMYNACDTLRNLPEILESSLRRNGTPIPLFRLHIPAVPLSRPFASSYLKERIRDLIGELEKFTDKAFSGQAFLRSTGLYKLKGRLSCDLERLAAAGRLGFADCSDILLSAGRMTLDDQIATLERTIREANDRPPGQPAVRVMLSGILPPPGALLDAIEHAGLTVAANDIAALRRSYGYLPAASADPGAYYEDFYRNHYPCTTILPSADRRLKTIRQILRENCVQGFIFVGEKFCEYEYFEIPAIKRMLEAESVRTLELEIDMDDALNIDAYRTRIEAFAEMLRQETRGSRREKDAF
jgi:benzoyl-CoA reductase/2-hydroxyglutaryl-CoA dehydratase subunit BcrC/BadD/HgdB